MTIIVCHTCPVTQFVVAEVYGTLANETNGFKYVAYNKKLTKKFFI
jgi:hypothetical protein